MHEADGSVVEYGASRALWERIKRLDFVEVLVAAGEPLDALRLVEWFDPEPRRVNVGSVFESRHAAGSPAD